MTDQPTCPACHPVSDTPHYAHHTYLAGCHLLLYAHIPSAPHR